MLRVEGVVVRFPATETPLTVLDGADLEVAEGEIVSLLGPSGSGKSTLLRVIAGLQHPDAGRVWLDGVDITDVPTHRRGIGLVFQHQALFPHLDVQGNVAFGLRMQHWTKPAIAARVTELMDLVGLTGMEHRRVETLSGGEQQRVAVARTLAPRPRLVLLDEPFGALDRELHDRLLAEVRGLFGQLGTSAVHVTHDPDEALALSDRIVELRHGRLAPWAPPGPPVGVDRAQPGGKRPGAPKSQP